MALVNLATFAFIVLLPITIFTVSEAPEWRIVIEVFFLPSGLLAAHRRGLGNLCAYVALYVC